MTTGYEKRFDMISSGRRIGMIGSLGMMAAVVGALAASPVDARKMIEDEEGTPIRNAPLPRRKRPEPVSSNQMTDAQLKAAEAERGDSRQVRRARERAEKAAREQRANPHQSKPKRYY